MSNFIRRHVGSSLKQIEKMYKDLCLTPEKLVNKTIPINIQKKFSKNHALENPEYVTSNILKYSMDQNKIYNSLVGLDYHQNILPNVIKRNILEDPRWYTGYTPYQSEISQGRLESSFNFQTLVSELTGLPITNCSLLDTGSASVEAMNMAFNIHREKREKFVIDDKLHPHIQEILRTRAEIMDVELVTSNINDIEKHIDGSLFGYFFSYPDTLGNINLRRDLINELKNNNTIVISKNDPLSLLLLKSPGEIGVDISLGTTQRMGLPMWYGGPHSAFFATKEEYIRLMPGRIIGRSIDRNNKPAYRMALQTREQHIKKSRATSNICTSQALLANVSSMWAIYHGKENMISISNKIKNIRDLFLQSITKFSIQWGNLNLSKNHGNYGFDTVSVEFLSNIERDDLFYKLKNIGYLSRRHNDKTLIFCFDETNDIEDVMKIMNVFFIELSKNKQKMFFVPHQILDYAELNNGMNIYSEDIKRDPDSFLNQSIFAQEKSETWMMRYINYLSNKDYSLSNGMIPLGSCTMKLNGVSQLEPLSYNTVGDIHPFAPKEDCRGYENMIRDLTLMLLKVTGMSSISYSSNSGAMGEYLGLLCIKKYHQKNVDEEYGKVRNLVLIPKSAHGTNFASAKLANMKIKTYDDDKITLNEFRNLAKSVENDLACLMVTYPNTYGIFDENIKEITSIIHECGGLVYMDGANMNAQCGITTPGDCGADVCHLNLHKTFCIPHGGGGPGMGPIAVNKKLEEFLPSNIYTDNYYNAKRSSKVGMITNSENTSAALLAIPYHYLKTVGIKGLKEITSIALLNANYIKTRLEPYYKIYQTNKNGMVGHEFIIDLNEFKQYGITEKDIAKRLIDYSFHPPTMSWPINGAIMIEPTESEDLDELNRFIEAMISIRKEIDEVRDGIADKENNVLKNSPHPVEDLENWEFPYCVQKAVYPVENLRRNKHWASHARVNDVYGDKNLIVKRIN